MKTPSTKYHTLTCPEHPRLGFKLRCFRSFMSNSGLPCRPYNLLNSYTFHTDSNQFWWLLAPFSVSWSVLEYSWNGSRYILHANSVGSETCLLPSSELWNLGMIGPPCLDGESTFVTQTHTICLKGRITVEIGSTVSHTSIRRPWPRVIVHRLLRRAQISLHFSGHLSGSATHNIPPMAIAHQGNLLWATFRLGVLTLIQFADFNNGASLLYSKARSRGGGGGVQKGDFYQFHAEGERHREHCQWQC